MSQKAHTLKRRMKIGLATLLLAVGALAAVALSGMAELVHIPADDPIASAPYLESSLPSRPLAWCVRGPYSSRPQTFSTLDLSGFWHSMLLPVLGACQAVELDGLELPPPPQVRLMVLSASAAAGIEQLPQALSVQLERWVVQGGVLWVEQPGPQLLARLDPQVQPQGRARARAMVLKTAVAAPEFEFTQLEGSPSGQVLLTTPPEQGKRPLVWSLPRGEGAVLVSMLELSRLLTRMVQGQPEEDFRVKVPERAGALRGIPVPSDLTTQNPEWDGPFALALLEHLWAASSRLVFLPGWWRHPHGAPGTFVMTHDEEAFGDRSAFMAEEEARLGERSSTFVLHAPLTAAGARGLERHGMELLLHWHRGFLGGNTEPLQVGPARVGSRALTLSDQRTRVEALVGRGIPAMTRIHGLQWDADWDSTFRRMVAAGISLDSSYGPIGQQSSWRFGTLEPFFPLDRTGRVLPLLELPFALQDDEAPPYARLKDLILGASREGWTVVPIVHVNTMAYKPSVGPLEAWLESFGWAKSAGLWRGTLGELLAFHQDRLRSEVRVEVVAQGQYQLQLVSEGGAQWLRVPGQVGERRLEVIRSAGGRVIGEAQRQLTGGDWIFRAESGLYEVEYR